MESVYTFSVRVSDNLQVSLFDFYPTEETFRAALHRGSLRPYLMTRGCQLCSARKQLLLLLQLLVQQVIIRGISEPPDAIQPAHGRDEQERHDAQLDRAL